MLTEQALAEAPRWRLWLPVLLGCGVLLWHALPRDPPPLAWALILPLLPAGFWLTRPAARFAPLRILMLALGLLLAGAAAAEIEMRLAQTRFLPRAMSGHLEAMVLQAAPTGSGLALMLDPIAMDGEPLAASPLRITARGETAALPEGARIRIRVRIQPPSAPAAPGLYDFRRHAWFAGQGGIGYSLGPLERLDPEPVEGAASPFARLRARLSAALQQRLSQPAGAVAAALSVGDRVAIPQAVEESLRDAGLSHLLSISGLHIGLAAGLVFAGLRGLLALSRRATDHWPIHKPAALAGLTAAILYTALAGAEIATLRACAMAGLAMLAILLDRYPFSLHSLSVAAVLLILALPHAVLLPGFQMSFAAVAALIGLVPAGSSRGLRNHLRLTLLTALTAAAATAPFVAWHFQEMQPWGPLANLAAVPLTGLVIMPSLLAAALLAPFGLEGLALPILDWGLRLLLALSDAVSAWPGAALAPGQVAAAVPLLAGLAIAWGSIWRRPWRRLAWIPAALALGLILLGRPAPAAWLSPRGMILAEAAATGWSLDAPGRTRDGFMLRQWRRAGRGIPLEGRLPPLFPTEACSSEGCRIPLARGLVLGRALTPAGAEALCRQPGLSLILAPVRPKGCRRVVTLAELRRMGGAVLSRSGRLEPAATRCRRWSPPDCLDHVPAEW